MTILELAPVQLVATLEPAHMRLAAILELAPVRLAATLELAPARLATLEPRAAEDVRMAKLLAKGSV